ncbi:ABC transporter substrate-binding protein [Azospirillum sp. ST 5-10]|uniref:ABC transporter substrate-binding protein n=1 Tax=unclassified Azospirillum TaxID=2630922 RepID=UPI003F4A62CD
MLKTVVTAAVTAAAVVALGTAAARAEMSDRAIRVGVLGDGTGPLAGLAADGSAVAARLAAAELGGRIAGRPIEILVADHRNRAEVAAATARDWIDRKGVDAIADVPNSAAALAVQEVARAKGRVVLASAPATGRLTGDFCSPTGFHWTYDARALAVGTATALTREGGRTWFFVTADYAFGHALEDAAAHAVAAAGGRVLGSVRHPLDGADLTPFLKQAQASGADVIALASAGGDAVRAVRQAAGLGIARSGRRLAALLLFLPDVEALGLETAQGLWLTTAFYWDRDASARAWSAAFAAKAGRPPTMVEAGVYSAVRHYLKAVAATGTDDGPTVAAAMRAAPVEDPFTPHGRIAANGRMFHDLSLVRVKAPAESAGPWDDYAVVATVPADEAFVAPARSGCPLAR